MPGGPGRAASPDGRERSGRPPRLIPSTGAAPGRRAGRRLPLQVDLVAAVHVGSRSYYETLDRLFKHYDAVLYELVAPENARVPRPGRKPAGAIGSAQQGLTKLLGLEFQLEAIDALRRGQVLASDNPFVATVRGAYAQARAC